MPAGIFDFAPSVDQFAVLVFFLTGGLIGYFGGIGAFDEQQKGGVASAGPKAGDGDHGSVSVVGRLPPRAKTISVIVVGGIMTSFSLDLKRFGLEDSVRLVLALAYSFGAALGVIYAYVGTLRAIRHAVAEENRTLRRPMNAAYLTDQYKHFGRRRYEEEYQRLKTEGERAAVQRLDGMNQIADTLFRHFTGVVPVEAHFSGTFVSDLLLFLCASLRQHAAEPDGLELKANIAWFVPLSTDPAERQQMLDKCRFRFGKEARYVGVLMGEDLWLPVEPDGGAYCLPGSPRAKAGERIEFVNTPPIFAKKSAIPNEVRNELSEYFGARTDIVSLVSIPIRGEGRCVGVVNIDSAQHKWVIGEGEDRAKQVCLYLQPYVDLLYLLYRNSVTREMEQ